MDTSVNFKGVFWLKQPTKAVKRDILPTLGKHRQIFNNFTPEGDVLYVTRKGCDKNVADFLTHHRTKFEYYPALSTKSGFDDEMPKEAMAILSNYKDSIVTTIAELKNMFKLRDVKLGFSTRKKDNTLEHAINVLNIDMSNNIVKHRNGFNEIYTKDGDLVASISEPGIYGFRYARVEPKTDRDDVGRYAIRGGEKFTYVNDPNDTVTNGSVAFLKNYLKAVKFNRKTIHNAAHQ